MSSQFTRLFNLNKNAADTLRQEQREAIIDALQLCLYADEHFAFNEGKMISDWVGKFAWESQASLHEYSEKSVARVRRANDDEPFRREFLADLNRRLGDDTTKELAVKLCRRLAMSDGLYAQAEATLIAELKEAFGLK